MGAFSGAEPLVGEVTGLRTFRVDDGGLLLPLYSNEAWYDGANAAKCTPPAGTRRDVHAVPFAGCECGFYAYGTQEAARQNRQVRHVQAVVSCWGAVVAGTQGFRAEYARIDAVWLDADAPSWLRSRIMVRYPSARLYADSGAMLGEHPLTELDCYEPPRRARATTKLAVAVVLATLVVLGMLPYAALTGTHGLLELWIAGLVVTAGGTVWLACATRIVGHLEASMIVGSVLLWLGLPLLGAIDWRAGLAAWLMRFLLLYGISATVGEYLLGLLPHHFPLVRTPRERLRGVGA